MYRPALHVVLILQDLTDFCHLTSAGWCSSAVVSPGRTDGGAQTHLTACPVQPGASEDSRWRWPWSWPRWGPHGPWAGCLERGTSCSRAAAPPLAELCRPSSWAPAVAGSLRRKRSTAVNRKTSAEFQQDRKFLWRVLNRLHDFML